MELAWLGFSSTYHAVMAATGACGRGWCRAALISAALLLVVAGCTYADREPGVFGRDATWPTDPPPNSGSFPTPSPLPVANPELPVAGESVWTSADGLKVQVRFAVHALRRVGGATVLDWSVTPISGFNLRPGDSVPASVDLGLSRRGQASPSVYLVDAPSRTVYRPLGRASDGDDCLCTPIWLAQRNLRVGVTTLLQIAFPELPAALRTVDVNIATVPPFWRVPVAPVGQIPVANGPTDLTRPAEVDPVGDASDMFRYGASEQVFRVRIHRVIASNTFTSMEWAIISVTGGDGLEAASRPPFASAEAATLTGLNPVAASGPELRSGGKGTVLRTLVMTNRLTSDETSECLCTDLRDWPAVLRRPDKVATVVTNYPALSEGAQRVEVLLEGLEPIEVAVTPASDTGRRVAGHAPAIVRFWPFSRDNPGPGWEPSEWPTPIPGRPQLERHAATVERLVR